MKDKKLISKEAETTAGNFLNCIHKLDNFNIIWIICSLFQELGFRIQDKNDTDNVLDELGDTMVHHIVSGCKIPSGEKEQFFEFIASLRFFNSVKRIIKTKYSDNDIHGLIDGMGDWIKTQNGSAVLQIFNEGANFSELMDAVIDKEALETIECLPKI